MVCTVQKFLTRVPAGMVFGWEFVMDFILVSTVYAVAIGQPTFGVMLDSLLPGSQPAFWSICPAQHYQVFALASASIVPSKHFLTNV